MQPHTAVIVLINAGLYAEMRDYGIRGGSSRETPAGDAIPVIHDGFTIEPAEEKWALRVIGPGMLVSQLTLDTLEEAVQKAVDIYADLDGWHELVRAKARQERADAAA